MNSEAKTQDRRFTLKSWHLILAAVVLLVGALGLYIALHRDNTTQRLAALRAAGYPTSFAELAEYTRLPAGAANAAETYTQAFVALVMPVEEANVPLLGRARLPDRKAKWSEPVVQTVATYLASNQQCLTLLHNAAGIEHCLYGKNSWPGIPQAHATEMRRCAQLLHLSAVFQAQQGDAEAATVCVRDGLRLSDSLEREPALINHLVRVAMIGLALRGLDHSLSLTAFTDRQLQDLDAALTRTRGTLDFTQALITERCFMIETWRDPSLLGSSGQRPSIRLVPGMRGMWLADILESMEDRIEASRLPPTERLRHFRQADDELKQLSFLHIMAKIMTPALTRVAELDLRARAHLDLARTALALERYRLATGRTPERLEELVPQYLKQVPIDPFDNQPIRYRQTQPGYLLYSVDTDGQDNGGRERDDVPKGQPCDLCFIVTR